jgi:hypothetical protein
MGVPMREKIEEQGQHAKQGPPKDPDRKRSHAVRQLPGAAQNPRAKSRLRRDAPEPTRASPFRAGEGKIVGAEFHSLAPWNRNEKDSRRGIQDKIPDPKNQDENDPSHQRIIIVVGHLHSPSRKTKGICQGCSQEQHPQ